MVLLCLFDLGLIVGGCQLFELVILKKRFYWLYWDCIAFGAVF